jgi:NAD(P)-dependent dehydrogenase (short-subunit alcohol dehydrogenase family)
MSKSIAQESVPCKELSGCKALITGANRGLGAEIAARFMHAGADVMLCARDSDLLDSVRSALEFQSAAGQQVLAQKADVSCEADVDRLFDRVDKDFGRLDILVNCAGVCGPAEAFGTSCWAAWKAACEVNLYGTIYPCACAIPLMQSQQYGKIINISGGGATKPLPNLSAYAASKAAVVRFTETLALELRPFNIDVNAIAPGVLYTGLSNEFMKAGVESLGAGYFAEIERQKCNPMPAIERAAALCVFLASPASDGISGRLISAVWDPWPNLNRFRKDLEQSDILTLRRINPQDRGLNWDMPK